MLLVTVELFPGGSVKSKEELLRIAIVNDGTGIALGNYDVGISWGGDATVDCCRVEDYDRTLNVLDLVGKALDELRAPIIKEDM